MALYWEHSPLQNNRQNDAWQKYKLQTANVYDVIVMSYVGCLYLFWDVWENEICSHTMVPIRRIWGFSFQVQSGGVTTTTLVKSVTEKRLVRQGII